MINYFIKKITTLFIVICLGLQVFILLYNQKPMTENFSQKKITVENFSSIVLSKSGITKIGSEKLNKIDDDNIYLEGNSFLENKEYKIYGKDIFIKIDEEISNSKESVMVTNSMGELNAQGFENLDYKGIIIFKGEVEFIIDE